MPKFRVKPGAKLPYNDGERPQLAEGGTEVELPAHVAADVAVKWMLDPLDDEARFALLPELALANIPEIARTGAPHERVAALRAALDQQQAVVEATQRSLDQAERDQTAVIEQMRAAGADVAKTTSSTQIGGVPVRVIEHGEGVQASVVHGAPTELKPGAGGTIMPGSQAPQQPATVATSPGVAAPVPPSADKTAVADDAPTRQPAAGSSAETDQR